MDSDPHGKSIDCKFLVFSPIFNNDILDKKSYGSNTREHTSIKGCLIGV